MASPVERLEAWCDCQEFGNLDSPVIVDAWPDWMLWQVQSQIDAYRAIISEYLDQSAMSRIAARDVTVSGALARSLEERACGIYITIELLADAVNPEEK